ncbi:MAG: DUF2291 family protein [Verrucomicrobiales bacterium]
MSTSEPTLKSRLLLWCGGMAGVCVLLYLLPLFHIVPLKEARKQSAAAAFNAASYVETFWNDKLTKGGPKAVDAGELIDAFNKDSGDAAERYGHRLGLSSSASFFVSGSGSISSVDKGTIEITLKEGGTVTIDTGPVFGNAIRDGSGLLDVSKFPNSQDFNALSSEINRRVEESVFPSIREKATVGASVRFVGGVEITDSDTIPPLNLVPVVIEFP